MAVLSECLRELYALRLDSQCRHDLPHSVSNARRLKCMLTIYLALRTNKDRHLERENAELIRPRALVDLRLREALIPSAHEKVFVQ